MGQDIQNIERALHEQAPSFSDVLPRSLPVERLMRTVVVSIQRLPALLNCSQQSIMNSAMSAAVLGLEVDGVTGQGFLIPFKGQAQLVIGYKGYNTIGDRAGLTISAGTVREGDSFECELGSAAFVRHRPKLGGKRDIVGTWACASAPGRAPIVAVLGIDEIMEVKGRSPGAKRGESPWNDPNVGFPAMAEKTARRRLARSMPLRPFQQAVALEDSVDQDKTAYIQGDGTIVIDGEASPLPSRTTIEADAIVGRREAAGGKVTTRDVLADFEGVETMEDLARVNERHQTRMVWLADNRPADAERIAQTQAEARQRAMKGGNA